MHATPNISPAYIGLDLGGTKIAAGVYVPGAPALSHWTVVPTQAHEGPQAVLERVAALVHQVCAEANITPLAVGIGTPGVLSPESDRILLTSNLPGDWARWSVTGILREALGLPVALINDARAFTLAEATIGAGKGASIVVCFTLGTGIGGGAAFNGRLHIGVDGTGAEFGHMVIEPDGVPCNCGSHGCLELYASGTGIARLGTEAMQAHPESRLWSLSGRDASHMTTRIIQQAAEEGDFTAREVLAYAGRCLGIGIANVVMAFGADCVVIGGGTAQLGDWLLAPMRQTFAERCRTVPVEEVTIALAALGQEAGAIGAALWASQCFPSQHTS